MKIIKTLSLILVFAFAVFATNTIHVSAPAMNAVISSYATVPISVEEFTHASPDYYFTIRYNINALKAIDDPENGIYNGCDVANTFVTIDEVLVVDCAEYSTENNDFHLIAGTVYCSTSVGTGPILNLQFETGNSVTDSDILIDTFGFDSVTPAQVAVTANGCVAIRTMSSGTPQCEPS